MKKLLISLLLFVMISITITPEVIAQGNCVAPTSLSAGNATTSSIQLSWTPAPGAMFYNVRYRPSGTTVWTQFTSQLPSYNLSGLTCGTVYEWQVQSVCSNSGASSVSPFTPSLLFTIPPCSGTCPTPSGLSASNAGVNQVTLSWLTSTGAISYNIRYRNINVTNWTQVSNVNSPYTLGPIGCNASYVWQVQAVCSNSSGNTSVSPWSANGNFSTLPCPGSCPAPTGLASSNISNSAATVSWNAVTGAGSYTVRYRIAGSLNWILTNAIGTSKNLNNLLCNSNYEWQVRANCSVASNSGINVFSPSANFTTLVCPATCMAPAWLTVSNITATSAVLTWNSVAGAVGYQVQYMATGGTSFITVSVTGTSTTLTGLLANTAYIWQVRTLCGGSTPPTTSPWSSLNTFITSQINNPCATPSIVSYSGTSVAWTPVPGAVSYNFRYRISGANNWTVLTTAVANITLPPLQSGSVYEYQVQTVCSGTNGALITSPWSPSVFYTVPAAVTVYPNPSGDIAMVSYESPVSENALIEIIDRNGNIVYATTLSSDSGTNNTEINTSGMQDGWYQVRITSAHFSGNQKLVIRH